jgi:hypothetical protein
MTLAERVALIEAVTTARREVRSDGRVVAAAAWHDLDAAARDEAFEATVTERRMEAAVHPAGLSTTARAVLARIRAS